MKTSIFPYLVVIFMIVQFVRAMLKANKQQSEHEGRQDETEEQKRMREIQERIRRKIAERRGGVAPPALPPASFAPEQPRPRPTVMAPAPTAGPLDPFGGPVHREVIRRVFAPPSPPPLPTPAMDSAALARQEQLAEQLQDLEAQRLATERRVEQLAVESALVTAAYASPKARVAWLADLRSADNLRRAIVLRELIGPPVGLR